MSNAVHVQSLRDTARNDAAGRFVAEQLLVLHDAASARPGGTFLELGTDSGQASRAILAACEVSGGRLVSVDLRDCSNAAQSSCWTFVQADSIDVDAVTAAAPVLSDGIDLVYVDSLHTPDHVRAEIVRWFPLLKPGGAMYFDDVDSGRYMRGHPKDNPRMENDNRQIREVIEDIFYANLDAVNLELIYGSTGLAKLTKRNGFGEGIQAPVRPLPRRRSMFVANWQRRLGLLRYKPGFVNRGVGG